jgi:uncharacterized Zn finger protein
VKNLIRYQKHPSFNAEPSVVLKLEGLEPETLSKSNSGIKKRKFEENTKENDTENKDPKVPSNKVKSNIFLLFFFFNLVFKKGYS